MRDFGGFERDMSECFFVVASDQSALARFTTRREEKERKARGGHHDGDKHEVSARYTSCTHAHAYAPQFFFFFVCLCVFISTLFFDACKTNKKNLVCTNT
jgi:hypothetical protein